MIREIIAIVAAGLILCGILRGLFSSIRIQKKAGADWEDNRQRGQARIVHWSCGTDVKGPSATAVILGIGNQQPWSVKDFPPEKKEQYPEGSVIDVEYAQYPYMGMEDYIDIRFIKEVE